MRLTFLFLFLATCGCVAQQNDTDNSQSVTTVLDVKSFKDKLSHDKGAVLIDFRTPEEAARGIIPGAMVIDFKAPDFEEKIAKLDKGKDYLIYCKAGTRSAKAAAQMESIGFIKIFNLEGGYDNWVANGQKTTKPK